MNSEPMTGRQTIGSDRQVFGQGADWICDVGGDSAHLRSHQKGKFRSMFQEIRFGRYRIAEIQFTASRREDFAKSVGLESTSQHASDHAGRTRD